MTDESIPEGFIISAYSDGGQSNRLFLILAIGLIGLICLGLLGLGATFFFRQSARDQAQALATAPVPPTPIPATFTPTATSSPTPTETLLPTPTNTSVLGPDGAAETGEAPVDTPTTNPEATPTNTSVVQSPTPEPTATPTSPPPVIPDSGGVLSVANNRFLGWIGSGLLLILIIYGVLHRFKLLQGAEK